MSMHVGPRQLLSHAHRPDLFCKTDLLCMQALELAVPGTYLAGEPVVTIAGFAPQLTVITSKQRPRKLTIHGSDGAEYQFLLKVCPGRSCPSRPGQVCWLSKAATFTSDT